MKDKIILLVKKYWKEIVIIIMFLNLQSGVNDARENAKYAYDYAEDASRYARYAYDAASDASSYASDAADYASEAADNSSYCSY